MVLGQEVVDPGAVAGPSPSQRPEPVTVESAVVVVAHAWAFKHTPHPGQKPLRGLRRNRLSRTWSMSQGGMWKGFLMPSMGYGLARFPSS